MPVITNPAHESLINGSTECQRLALLNFFRTTRSQEEGNPIDHAIDNTAILGKVDAVLNPANHLSASYNFDYSKNDNQTFDVATYGNSANGIEGPSKIGVFNLNLFTTLSSSKFNEFHVTYARELRPRNAIESNVPPDTGMGNPAFRLATPTSCTPASMSCSGGRRSRTTCRWWRDATRSRSAASGSTRSTIRSSVGSSTAATCLGP